MGIELKSKQLGEYQLSSLIGKGELTEVWRGESSRFDSPLALKLLPTPPGVIKNSFVERFKREMEPVARLEHPAILALLDYGLADNYCYTVCGYQENGTLQQSYNQGAFSRPESFTVFEKLLEGLGAAHLGGVIHGHLKPSSVFLDQEGQPHIADFGIARVLHDRLTANLKLITGLAGAPEYKAPEQFNGQVSERSDLYAAGIILHWLLTGKAPFTGTSSRLIGIRHSKEAIILRGLPVPRLLVRFLVKALDKQPENRYHSAADMLTAFQESIASLGPEDLQDSPAPAPTKPARPPERPSAAPARPVVTPRGSTPAPAPRTVPASRPVSSPVPAAPPRPASRPAPAPAAPPKVAPPVAAQAPAELEPEVFAEHAPVETPPEEAAVAGPGGLEQTAAVIETDLPEITTPAEEAPLERQAGDPAGLATPPAPVEAATGLETGLASAVSADRRSIEKYQPGDGLTSDETSLETAPATTPGPEFEAQTAATTAEPAEPEQARNDLPEPEERFATPEPETRQLDTDELVKAAYAVMANPSAITPIIEIIQEEDEPAAPPVAASAPVEIEMTGPAPVATRETLPEAVTPQASVAEAAPTVITETSPPAASTPGEQSSPDLAPEKENPARSRTRGTGRLDNQRGRGSGTLNRPKVDRKLSQMYRQKKQIEQIPFLNEAIEQRPDWADAYQMRGLAYFQQQQYEQALLDFNRAIELDEEYSYAYYVRGNTYAALRQHQRAIEDFNQAIELDPNDAYAFNHRGVAYHELKQFSQAIEDFDRALTLNPHDAAAYYVRGLVYFDSQQYERAIEDFDQAIKLNPNYVTAYTGRGNSYFNLQQYERAIQDYNQAINLNPDDPMVYNNRANAFRKLKQYKRSLLDYNRMIELYPKYPAAYDQRGSVFADIKQYEAAIDNFDRAIALDPGYAPAYSHRGNAYFDTGQYRQAIVDYNRAIELNPYYTTALNGRGLTYYQMQQYELALQDLNRAIELNPGLTIAYNNRALVLTALKRYNQSIQDFNQVISSDSGAAEAFCGRGNVYRALQQYQQAMDDFNRAIELNSNLAAAFNGRGLVYFDLQHFHFAVEDFNRAVELDPNLAAAYNNLGSVYLWLDERERASEAYQAAWTVSRSEIKAAWLAEWSLMTEKPPSKELISRIVTIAASDPNHYVAQLCRGVALALKGKLKEGFNELEQVNLLVPEDGDAYFWKGLVGAYLGRNSVAATALDKASQCGLPPALFRPLQWLNKDRPDFYKQTVMPLLARLTPPENERQLYTDSLPFPPFKENLKDNQ